MNQILVTENKKKSKSKLYSGPVEIRSVILFFAIFIIAFAVSLIGQGSYAMYREAKAKSTDGIPEVTTKRVNDTIIVKAVSVENIINFKYSWNDAEQTVIPIENTVMEEEIVLPNENSILYIVIENESGRAVRYQKEIFVEGLDIAKPSITVTEEQTQGNIKISATDDIMIEYMIYQINEESEVRIDRSEMEEKTINYVLKLERGENKLKVTAVDTSGNIEIIEKTIIVSELPTIELEQNGKTIIATIKDTDGVKDVEVNLNGVIYLGENINQKEIKVPLELKEGVNTIKIKVTNVNGLVAEGVKELNYAE